jgi:hypothetical protein
MSTAEKANDDEFIAAVIEELRIIRGVGLDSIKLERLVVQLPLTTELSVPPERRDIVRASDAAESIVLALKLVCQTLGKDEVSSYARMLFRQTKETADLLTPGAARRYAAQQRRVQLRQWKNRYETIVLEKLARKLTEGEWQTAILAAPELSSELATPEAPGGYVIELFDISYRFRAGQVASTAVCSCTLRAVRNGVSSYETYTTYFSDRRPDVINVEALDGCEVDEDASGYAHGYQTIRFTLPYELREGESHRLWYVKTIDSSKRARPFYGISRDHSIETLKLEIQFADDAWPRKIWRFERLSANKVPGGPSEGSIVTLNHRGHVQETFKMLRPGFYSGLGWTWDR